MTNRKILYGYQIQNGDLVSVDNESTVVSRVYTLYAAGASYQKISDALNKEHIPFSEDDSQWNKHKVKRMLENPRYTGQDGYPAIIGEGIFQAVQEQIREKTAAYAHSEKRMVLNLKPYLRCGACEGELHRLGGKNRRKDTLYLKCESCGTLVTIQDSALLDEVSRQMEEHKAPSAEAYQPSAEVIRLTNAINRSLEHPDAPEEIISLILQGAAARYDSCSAETEHHISHRPAEVDLKRFGEAVSHITITGENIITVHFK